MNYATLFHFTGVIVRRLACRSHDVKIYAAIHTDKPGNLHAHFLASDGLETWELARRRAGKDAQRIFDFFDVLHVLNLAQKLAKLISDHKAFRNLLDVIDKPCSGRCCCKCWDHGLAVGVGQPVCDLVCRICFT